MTIVLKNNAIPTITVSHGPDGSITIYTSGGTIVLDPVEAVKLAEYITASQPE